MPSNDSGHPPFEPGESFARALDQADPLRSYRDRFQIPDGTDGQPVVYFAGNSLGLQPARAAELVREELQSWADRAVEGHFAGPRPWYSYHELLRETGARLVGARPGEVVVMNSLTVNLHLMMVSFFRPTAKRFKILIEEPCFPSDLYAVKSQLRYHGLDPSEALIVVRPRPGEHLLRMEDVASILARDGDRIALVLLGGVNFVTGQLLDMERITSLGHDRGCVVGLDLAHAAGNVPLSLHDWGVDFAVWCNYKYLNSGPGAVGGCFVHERHGQNADLPRFAGWWGNDPATRFKMHLIDDFVPREGAEGWQISNPPIFAMAPVKASYDLFDEAGMDRLREKSKRLTGYLAYLLERCSGYSGPRGSARGGAADRHGGSPDHPMTGAAGSQRRERDHPTTGPQSGQQDPPTTGTARTGTDDGTRGGTAPAGGTGQWTGEHTPPAGKWFEIITPADPEARGCQLSLRFHENARAVLEALQRRGVVCDFREPDVIRVAPVPLYNTFHDAWRFAESLDACCESPNP